MLYKTITTEVMNDNKNTLESLLESAVDCGKTGYELVKLKTLDKTANVLSSLISHYATLILFASCILFISILRFWAKFIQDSLLSLFSMRLQEVFYILPSIQSSSRLSVITSLKSCLNNFLWKI